MKPDNAAASYTNIDRVFWSEVGAETALDLTYATRTWRLPEDTHGNLLRNPFTNLMPKLLLGRHRRVPEPVLGLLGCWMRIVPVHRKS